MQRADSLEKTLMLGKIEGRRKRWWQKMRWLDGITDSIDRVWANSRRWKDRGARRAAVHGVAKSRTWLNNNNDLSAVFGLHSGAVPRPSSLPPLLLKPITEGHMNTWASSRPPWASCSRSPSTCDCPRRSSLLRSGGFPQKQAMQTQAPLIRSAHSRSEFCTQWFCWRCIRLKDSGHIDVPALCQAVPTASCLLVIWVFLAVPSQRWHPSEDLN